MTPAPQHEDGIRAAIAARKDVYSEWPLTPSEAISLELTKLADKTGVRHIVGLQRRLAPIYRFQGSPSARLYWRSAFRSTPRIGSA